MISRKRRTQQRGSALLVVLVFAAMLAIMLYREMPVVAFEAERQKEELLMDRGNEYSRAVKLYVRKFQMFPPSLEALENTNRMRFLRARYADPYTGKDDWRLLHAGPGGTIIDSKVKPTGVGANGAPGQSGSSSPLGAPAASANFANSFDGANPNGQPATAGNAFPQRPPAIANGGGMAGGNGVPADPSQQTDPQAMAQAAGFANSGFAGQAQNGGVTDPSQGGGAQMPMGTGRFRGVPNGAFPQQNPTDGSIPPVAGPQDPQSMMQSLLNSQNPAPNPSAPAAAPNSSATASTSAFGSPSTPATGAANGSTGTQMGSMSNSAGGGIAGVASKSTGHTIKILNDQTDRSLWEFVYDMQKEAMANAPGGGALPNNNNNGNNNGANGTNTTNSGSGFTPITTSFSQSGTGNSPPQSQPQQTSNQ